MVRTRSMGSLAPEEVQAEVVVVPPCPEAHLPAGGGAQAADEVAVAVEEEKPYGPCRRHPKGGVMCAACMMAGHTPSSWLAYQMRMRSGPPPRRALPSLNVRRGPPPSPKRLKR